jgi:hypothetical protein
LKAPTETDLLALEELLVAEKSTLGRNTGGRTHGAQGVFAMARVVDTILSNVYDATVVDYDAQKLKSIIKVTDLHPLVLGFATAIYPQGYPFSRVCVADPTKCKHVTEEVVNLSRLLFMDRTALTPKHMAHMRRKSSRFTDIELKAYQDEFAYNQKVGVIDINDTTKLTLRVPTLAEAEMSGREWIDEISRLIDSQTQEEIDDRVRDQRISQMALAQASRQYAAWVEKITLNATDEHEGEIIDERKDIAANIGNISGNIDYEEAFYSGIEKYITTTTMGVVAVPNYKCPGCGKEQQKSDPMEEATLRKHPHLIALDTIQTFFTLLSQKTDKIRRRRLG